MAAAKFLKTLRSSFYQCFKKIRIKSSKTFPYSIKNKNDKNLMLKAELENIIKNSISENEVKQATQKLLEEVSK